MKTTNRVRSIWGIAFWAVAAHSTEVAFEMTAPTTANAPGWPRKVGSLDTGGTTSETEKITRAMAEVGGTPSAFKYVSDSPSSASLRLSARFFQQRGIINVDDRFAK